MMEEFCNSMSGLAKERNSGRVKLPIRTAKFWWVSPTLASRALPFPTVLVSATVKSSRGQVAIAHIGPHQTDQQWINIRHEPSGFVMFHLRSGKKSSPTTFSTRSAGRVPWGDSLTTTYWTVAKLRHMIGSTQGRQCALF
jgi:hypothetical protein